MLSDKAKRETILLRESNPSSWAVLTLGSHRSLNGKRLASQASRSWGDAVGPTDFAYGKPAGNVLGVPVITVTM